MREGTVRHCPRSLTIATNTISTIQYYLSCFIDTSHRCILPTQDEAVAVHVHTLVCFKSKQLYRKHC